MAGKIKKKGIRILGWVLAALILAAAGRIGYSALQELAGQRRLGKLMQAQLPDWVDVQLIDVDGAARRGEGLESMNGIVIHYVGNPGTTAQQNRNYFNNPETQVSSHFLVGLEGEVILCVPMTEKASASNHRNKDTISIEVCHPDETGEFTRASYEVLVKLTAWLLEITGLEDEDVIRHYDVTGKECPRYFVIHEESWEVFREDVNRASGG